MEFLHRQSQFIINLRAHSSTSPSKSLLPIALASTIYMSVALISAPLSSAHAASPRAQLGRGRSMRQCHHRLGLERGGVQRRGWRQSLHLSGIFHVETVWADPSLLVPRPNTGENKIDLFHSTSSIIS
jgi:hypothetical protein